MDFPSMYAAAMYYIQNGLAVFPLEEQGKKPKTRNGCKDATTDAAQVKAWWQEYPNANIGIATGAKSGNIFVIDLDIDEDRGIDGYHSLTDWERENGQLPDTWRAITGRGGYHLYFRTDKEVRNRAGIIDGVDVRGEGGYVVAPPSIHANGTPYEWEDAPDEVELAQANDTVNYFLQIGSRGATKQFYAPEVIREGTRNENIFKFACMMQAKGSSDEAVYAATMAENQAKCRPPLGEKEVRTIVNNVLEKYQKGKPIAYTSAGEVVQGQREPMFETNDKGFIKQTIANACEAIAYDPELYGHIKYNLLSYSPFIVGALPWEHINMYREWNNSDDSNLKSYIEKKYGLRSMDKIMEALNIVTGQNPFNPVVDMLEDFSKGWDKKTGYIRRLLPDYLGVEDTEYTFECMKLFMLGAISRAYMPGCKFDYMPVFVGKQGIGKSTFLRLLSMNNAWYNDNFNTVEGDKAPEKLRGMWMVELAELLATRKAKDVESIKAFLTSTVDTYRPPYGRRTEQRPRVCVFAGTTNNDFFLTDKTGNRRFLPIVTRKEFVKKSMFENREAVVKDFEQAWGEAMHYYKQANGKPTLVLPKHLEKQAQAMQNAFVEEDVRIGIIQNWLDNTEEQRVCVAMLYEKALGNEDRKPNRFESNDLHSIMSNEIKGWKKIENSNGGRAKCRGYGLQICYERIDENFVEMDENEPNPFKTL